jgi:hypothetical protein
MSLKRAQISMELHPILNLLLQQLKELKLSHYTPRRRLGGEEVQLLLILDLGTRWGMSGQRHSPVPIVQEAGWAPEPVWTQRLEGKSFASAGDRT